MINAVKRIITALALLTTPAIADITTVDGNWVNSFIEYNSESAGPQCVISTTTPDNMNLFAMKYFGASDSAEVQIFSKYWGIGPGTYFTFMIGFDGYYVVEGRADITPARDGGGYTLMREQGKAIVDGLRYGRSMVIGFVDNGPPWFLGMYGSAVAIEKFRSCAVTLSGRYRR